MNSAEKLSHREASPKPTSRTGHQNLNIAQSSSLSNILHSAEHNPGSLRTQDILLLQRTVGNRATRQLLSQAPQAPQDSIRTSRQPRIQRQVASTVINTLQPANPATSPLVATADAVTHYDVYAHDVGNAASKTEILKTISAENARIGDLVHTNNRGPGLQATNTPNGKRYNFTVAGTIPSGDCTNKADMLVDPAQININNLPLNAGIAKRYIANNTAPNNADIIRASTLFGPTRYRNANVQSIDPFLYKIRGTYETHKAIELTYQHAKEWTGYVVGVKEYRTDHQDVGMANADHNNVINPGLPGHYSNQHAPTNDPLNQNIHPDTRNYSEQKNEKIIDTITKISGEGARWQCVRNHHENLTDNSKFFTRVGGGNVHYVTFQTLWLSWASVYNKDYDIDDAATLLGITNAPMGGAAVRPIPRGTFHPTGGGKQAALVNQMTDQDYDLDNGKPFKKEKETKKDTWIRQLNAVDQEVPAQVVNWYRTLAVNDEFAKQRREVLEYSNRYRMYVRLPGVDQDKIRKAYNSGDVLTAFIGAAL